MRNFCYPEKAIKFLQKGITLSLLILLNLAAYSNPMDKNTERKADNNFLSGKSLFTFFDHYLKNNLPEEASNAARPAECTYHMRRNSGRVPAGASSGNEFGFTVRGNNCSWTPVSNASWITNVAKPNMANLDDSWDVTYSCAANPTTSERSGTITMVGYTYTVTQAGAVCSVSLPSATGNVPATAGTGSFSVAANGNECTWTATVATEATWLSIPTGQTLVGSKALNYSYGPNPTTTARMGAITVNGHTYTITQAGAACSVSLPSTTGGVGFAAGRGSLQVVVQGSNCSEWTAAADQNAAWITIDEADRTGTASKTLNYSYTANTSTSNTRTGTILVQGNRYTVTQARAPDCRYHLSRNSANVSATASSGVFSFISYSERTADDSYCIVWTPVSNASWITNVHRGTLRNLDDSWEVYYSYAANTTTFERHGTITMVGYTFTVKQAGVACSISLPSTPRANVLYSSGTGRVFVVANGDNCEWTPVVSVNATGWLSIPAGQTLRGRGNLTYTYEANPTTTPRTGTITVAGHIYTITQARAMCTVTLASTTANVPAEEGTRSVEVVVQGTDCQEWSARVGQDAAGWLSIVGESSGRNSKTINYSYSENISTTPRTGRISVQGNFYTVTQLGRCTYTVSSRSGNVPATASSGNNYSLTVEGSNCSWTPTTRASWITGLTKSPTTRGNTWEVTFSCAPNPTTAPRTGTITIPPSYDLSSYDVIQAGGEVNCIYTLASSTGRVPATTGTGSVEVTTNRIYCPWTAEAAANGRWITILNNEGKGTGAGTVRYTYGENPFATERTGTILVSEQTYTLTQAGAAVACTYTLASSTGSAPAIAGTGSVRVTTNRTICPWTPTVATEAATWLSIIIQQGQGHEWVGTNTFNYSYTANPSTTAREGRITLGGQTYTVRQARAACTISLSSTTADVPVTAGTGSVQVRTNGSECPWTATVSTDATWLSIVGESSGPGTKTLNYSYSANPTSNSREGRITVGGRTYTVRQAEAACTISLSSPTAALPATAGMGSVEVSVNSPECKWTAAFIGAATWLFITEAESSRTGSHTLHYSYTANPNTTPRTKIVNVAGQIYTVTQAGTTTPSCSYTLVTPETSIGAAASTAETKGSFSVTVQGTGCLWTPSPIDNWITNVTKAQTANSDGSWTVTYSYAANYSTIGRTGRIMVADKIHRVVQAEGCSYTLAVPETHIGVAASTAETRGSFSVTVRGISCSWTPSTTDNWITNITKVVHANANTSWTVTYSYMANTSSTERRGTIIVADKAHTVIQAGTATCSISLSSSTANLPATAGTGSVEVRANFPECNWTPTVASADAAWLFITGGEGSRTGTQALTYSHAANPAAAPRTGTITVAGQTYTVTQTSRPLTALCIHTVDPEEASIGAAASTAETTVSFSVTRVSENCSWTPVTADDWINVTKAASPNSDGTWDATYSYTANTSASERWGRIIVDDKIHTVIQAGATAACSYTLASNTGSVQRTAGSGSVRVVTTRTDCPWTATVAQEATWITITPGQILAGSKTVEYTFTENTATTLRTGTITVAGHIYTLTQAGTATPSCSYTLTPAEVRIGAAASITGGSFSVTVQGTGCSWAPATTADWIIGITKAATANTNGSWTVTYSYLANTTHDERTGTIIVDGQTHTVIQAAATATCSYTLASNTGSVQRTAGSGSVRVVSTRTDCPWTATVAQEATWITITPGQILAGSKAVEYTFTENTATTLRTGTITVAGHIYTLTQAGTATPSCSYTLTPAEARIGAAASTTTGSFSVTVQGTGCSWAVATTADWIIGITKAETANANGSWIVTYSYLENTTHAERTGTITVAGQTHTVIQAGATATCSYTLASNTGSAQRTAGSGSVIVTTRTDCSWTATVAQDATWITITPGQILAGSKTVEYTFTENTASAVRTGTITVAGHIYTLTQAGTATPSCSYTLTPAEARIGSAAATAETKGSFSVTVQGTVQGTEQGTEQGTDCSWAPATTADWIIGITKAATANANDSWTVTYSYQANSSTSERTGTITVAGQTYTVTQAGAACSISLPATTASVPDAAGTGSVEVVTNGTECTWMAESNIAWLTIPTGQTLVGSKNLTYSYTANTSTSERTGIITVVGQTFTVTQSAVVTGIEPSGGMSIFPNPAKDFVTIDLSADKIKYSSLKIVNQVGQIIYQLDTPPAQALQIPLNGFGSGMYFIFLQGEEKVLVKKLIVR